MSNPSMRVEDCIYKNRRGERSHIFRIARTSSIMPGHFPVGKFLIQEDVEKVIKEGKIRVTITPGGSVENWDWSDFDNKNVRMDLPEYRFYRVP